MTIAWLMLPQNAPVDVILMKLFSLLGNYLCFKHETVKGITFFVVVYFYLSLFDTNEFKVCFPDYYDCFYSSLFFPSAIPK